MNNLTQFISTDAGFAAVFSAVATLFATMLGQFLRGKVRLVWFSPNSTHFKLPQNNGAPAVHINSGQIIVQNLGRQAAQDVQITSVPGGIPPAGYVLIPSLVHSTRSGPQGEWIVEIPFISPGEVVTLQILNGLPIDSVRSAGGAGRYVPVVHQRLYPKWFQIIFAALMLIGVLAIFFLVGWIISRI